MEFEQIVHDLTLRLLENKFRTEPERYECLSEPEYLVKDYLKYSEEIVSMLERHNFEVTDLSHTKKSY